MSAHQIAHNSKMSVLLDGLLKTREFIQATFRQLPLFLVATLLFLGILETNVSYLFLTIGSVVLFGVIWVAQLLLGKIDALMPYITSKEACSVLGTALGPSLNQTTQIVAPSYYIGFLAFFFTYVFLNAYQLYSFPVPEKADTERVNNRIYQAGIAMFMCILLFLVFTIVRITKFGGCETVTGMVLGGVIGVPLAYGWYRLLRVCGGDAISDLFGIIGRLVPADTVNSTPVACMKTE